MKSGVTLQEFNPKIIPYQYEVIKTVRKFDYSSGMLEIMLSGSVGSAKSLLMAHIVITHCLANPKARCCLARQGMPDLKDTILLKVLEHISRLTDGKDYSYNASKPSIKFSNGSEIICRSWHDKRYERARSLELSMLAIEELTENDSKEFLGFYPEYKARLGRIPGIKENVIICATNPDSPSHSAYEYFINGSNKYQNRKVFYSVTSDNPFLPDWYIDNLKETYTEKQIERYIYGRWVDIQTEVIYYAFDESVSIIDSYKPDPAFPIILSYDFNIGQGKPMSVSVGQYIKGDFYFFNEIVVKNIDTAATIEEGIGRGIISNRFRYVIRGDAAGRARSTKSIKSDYDIIGNLLTNYGINHEIDVPMSNPPIRTRHNLVNGQLKNANGKTHMFFTKNCETHIKAMKQTRLKEDSRYLEVEDAWQHLSTAIGYNVVRQLKSNEETTRVICY